MLYDRAVILDTLIHRVNSFSEGYRQNIAIIGEPHIGKTSLIKSLLTADRIKKDSIIAIYLEIKIEPFEFCAKRFIKSALFQLLQSDPLLTESHETILLIEDLKRTYPKTAMTCMRVLQDIEKGKLDEAYSFMMDIPAVIFEETKKRCVLILDEFHNIGNFLLKHPYGILAKKIMIQKDTMFLFISSKNTVSQRLLNEKLSLLFGNFEKMFLPSFDIKISRALLQDNIYGTKLPQIYLDFIASFSGYKPFYMQVICDEIKKGIISNKVVPEDYTGLIEFAFIEALFKKSGIINLQFSNLFSEVSEGKQLSKTAAVLIALSSENKKQSDIVKSSKLQSRDVSRILNKLIEMDIIMRHGSFYRFIDKLFCFWIQSVYIKRILSFSIDESMEGACFKKDVRNRLSIFIREFEKELYSRIIDLFRLFKNDIIQLNGKRHKFFSFNNVEKLDENFSVDSVNILAVRDKLRWLCTIKKEYITENDIAGIIKNVKTKFNNSRINRSILVCLSGMDENAYLVAKQAKFWIWDLESLNVLMELYGKPPIGIEG